MSAAVGRSALYPRFILMAALCGLAASPAFAEIYKCKGSDGAPVFQEAPCGSAGGISAAPQPPAGAGKSSTKVKPADTTNNAMNEAFRSRMEKQDYDGALAFATTDAQKAQARKKAEEKRVKCESLSTKAAKAQAEYKNRGERLKPAADAADAEYRTHCK